MLHKTKAIVLNHIKYGETSIIVNMYTEAFGIQSYIENGVRKAKARNKIALFQPLTLLDLVVYKKSNASLNRISEIKCNQPYQQIPYEIIKSTIGIFLAEVLSSILREEEESNPRLFSFLESSLISFDQQQSAYQNFHLSLLLQLSSYLGFYPSGAEEVLEELRPFQTFRLDALQEKKFNQLLTEDNGGELKLTGEERSLFLKIILNFYQLHSHSIKEVKSLKVLREVLH
ncbi:DNA repair protein RecO [Marivirga atlantica]|uniref:DNA repair protein RecO n=1 Tax=Marivirga atlantica TaxID=1548457 RepID=A0A937ADF2_9BACT|nr:DNA repair protein RecO [Marivirga atlantica]MBL0764213.1 DNA repair protein RecO [Marivirga atlantica]